jgi:putative nucleotidyltransferase with HDIG domain
MSNPSSTATAAALPTPVRDKLVASIAQGTLELPVLPEVASQVVKLSGDPNSDTRQLAALIQRDQAMAGHLMRMANSTLYAPKVPLVSLDQVVSRMGMKKIREIALIISCQSKVFAVPGYEGLIKAQFRHSLAAAAFAQEIARNRRWNVEEAFLCGLLHDVGRPVLLQKLIDLHQELKLPLDPAAVEAAIGALHTRVGSDLVKSWTLPARMAETVLFHHDAMKSTSAAQTAMMTQLADELAHLLLTDGGRAVAEEAVRKHPLLVPLNLYPDELDALLALRPTVKAMVEAVS